MEFQLYKRHKQVLKNSIATFFFLVAVSCIGLMTRGKGGSESFYSRWDVPIYGYVLTFMGAIILGVVWLLIDGAKSTSQKILFEHNSIQFNKFKERIPIEDVVFIKRDYHQWMVNDESGNVWILKMKNKKEVRFLVERKFDDDLKKWINENIESMEIKA